MISEENKPTFSIITYNVSNIDKLKSCLSSIENQGDKDFEWIIINNDVTNNEQIIDTNLNLRWITEQTENIFDSMNVGIKNAQGKYLLFLDENDHLAQPDVLSKIAKIAEKNPDFIYGDFLLLPEQKGANKSEDKAVYKSAKRYKDLPKGMFTAHQAMFYKNSKIKELRLWYSVIYECAGNYDFTARFLKESQKIVYTPYPISILDKQKILQQNTLLLKREQYAIREKLKMVTQFKNLIIFLTQMLAIGFKKSFPKTNLTNNRSQNNLTDMNSP